MISGYTKVSLTSWQKCFSLLCNWTLVSDSRPVAESGGCKCALLFLKHNHTHQLLECLTGHLSGTTRSGWQLSKPSLFLSVSHPRWHRSLCVALSFKPQHWSLPVKWVRSFFSVMSSCNLWHPTFIPPSVSHLESVLKMIYSTTY